MALRERLIREGGLTGPLTDDAISNQQGFQDMKARLHRMLINRMDLTKLGMLEPEQLHDEVARLAPRADGGTATEGARARHPEPRAVHAESPIGRDRGRARVLTAGPGMILQRGRCAHSRTRANVLSVSRNEPRRTS